MLGYDFILDEHLNKDSKVNETKSLKAREESCESAWAAQKHFSKGTIQNYSRKAKIDHYLLKYLIHLKP